MALTPPGCSLLASPHAHSLAVAACLPACRHYIAHTRYLPRSRIGKAIRMHHMLHHTRNEANWLAFVWA